ncbi:MAG: 50S ribosomal protein L24 [Phycisphaerales bacterium]|nr:50S ribosomal protein L24 [Phycisphaerales bacterium]
MPCHVRKDDQVMITAGKYRGVTGTVVRVLHDAERVVVHSAQIDGIKKNLKPTRINPQGGQVEVDRSFHISNVSPVVDGKPTRVRFQKKADGSKVRVAARNGAELHVLRKARKSK